MPDTSEPRPHAVVIGAGFGGLAAAIRLGARGYRVTVLEKLDAPGGRAYVYRQDGFTFDAGPTIITAPYLLEELWVLCGRRMEDDIDLRAIDPFYTIRFDDGTLFNATADYAAMRAEVARISPADVAGFERFIVDNKKIYDVAFSGFAACCAQPPTFCALAAGAPCTARSRAISATSICVSPSAFILC